MEPLRIAASAALLISLPTAANARRFDVAPGRLGDVAIALGTQAGISVGVADPELAARRAPGVHGDIPVAEAFKRALRGTGARAIFLEPALVRIVRAPARRARPVVPAKSVIDSEASDIVVLASKQNIRLSNYPGSVIIFTLDRDWLDSNAAKGSSALVDASPSLGSTHLGSGRNKLFIRGIADSSFSGPSQSTVGQYFDDIRLTYSAPDPDLNLYDMRRVEVLVGPQGALYGAGSLGGVIRLLPNRPDPHEAAASLSTGVTFTDHGGVSGDGAAMVNLPVVSEKVAARFVVYGNRAAGYIDDPARGARGINSVTSVGGRFALRLQNLGAWAIDIGVVSQKTASGDGQYGTPMLTRRTAIAQPFSDDYLLGYLKVTRRIGSGQLVATSSNGRQQLATVFDASGYDGSGVLARYAERIDTTLSANEIRFSSESRKTPFVIGVSAIFSATEQARTLGPVGPTLPAAKQSNTEEETSFFGQITHPLSRTVSMTIGQRATFVRSMGTVVGTGSRASEKLSRNAFFASGTYALEWHPHPGWSTFVQLQQGYRPGGLSLFASSAGLEGQRYQPDKLGMGELGLRLGNAARDRLSFRGAVFYAEWEDIQADLIDGAGLPYTASIGSGKIYGFDGEMVWNPSDALRLTAAAFVAHSALTDPQAKFATKQVQPLPNVPSGGGRLGVSWHRELGRDRAVSATAAVRYVGGSLLGVGTSLDIPQGNYTEIDAGARLRLGRIDLSIDIDNLSNARSNTFSFGNPFGVLNRDQTTPLRPRTVRIGISARL